MIQNKELRQPGKPLAKCSKYENTELQGLIGQLGNIDAEYLL